MNARRIDRPGPHRRLHISPRVGHGTHRRRYHALIVGHGLDLVIGPVDTHRDSIEHSAAEHHHVLPQAVEADLLTGLVIGNDRNEHPRGAGAPERDLDRLYLGD